MGKNEKKLKQFYQDLAAWINAGMPEHPTFRKDVGLCLQLCRWTIDLPWYARLYYDTKDIRHLQDWLFSNKFGNSNFPFGWESYMSESYANNHYTNEARLDFIFEQAEAAREI